MADPAAPAPAPAPAQAQAAAAPTSAAAPAAAPPPAPATDSASGPSSDSGPEAGSQRLLFSHDLVSGRYRGSVHFGLVRLIHGEDSDSEGEEDGRGSSGCSEAGGAGHEEGRASPLRRGYVRVQWYPEGVKQHVKETKVRPAGEVSRARRGGGGGCRLSARCTVITPAWARTPAGLPARGEGRGLASDARLWCWPQGDGGARMPVGTSSGAFGVTLVRRFADSPHR